MADKKISALTPATTPLDGTEVLPIVQGASTVKVANNDLRPKQIQSNATSGVLQVSGPTSASTRVMTTPDANFTAARTDAAQSLTGDQTLSTGNLIQGTAAKGITTGGAFALGLGTNGSTSQATLETDGSLKTQGILTSKGNTGSISNNTAVTIFSVSAGFYTVACRLLAGTGDVTNWSIFATVICDGSSSKIVANNTVYLMLSLSGNNVQVTQTSGGTQPAGISFSYLKQTLD